MDVDLRPLGDKVRELRREHGFTLKDLAQRSGVSLRFLSDLERGQGNISIARLVEVAVALGRPLSELVAPLDGAARAGVLAREDVRPIALVGLRGAGKSTIGLAVAVKLDGRFVELDAVIESAAGLPLGQIFEIHGEAYYRRLEREALTELLEHRSSDRSDRSDRADRSDRERAGVTVIATGGGIVADARTWSLLKRRARTVWLKARPEEHYRRVMAQGDTRPMKNRPLAMAELRALLASRAPRYAEAELTVDTSALGVQEAAERIVRWARP